MSGPRIVTHISLSVTNLDRSLGFYRDVLGFRTLVEPFNGEAFHGREAIVVSSASIGLCLQQHDATMGEAFDSRRAGLDHLAFAVDSLAELEAYDEATTSLASVSTSPPASAHGSARDVLVSRTVCDLAAGSDLQFENRGTHQLKGVPGSWELFALAQLRPG